MASRGAIVHVAAIVAIALLAGCSYEEGTAAVGFEDPLTPYVISIKGSGDKPPCLTGVIVEEKGSAGARELRQFVVPQGQGCVRYVNLNGTRYRASGSGEPIRKGAGKKYSLDVLGAGLKVSIALDAS